MDVYLIRHAEAVERETTDLDDFDRPLTDLGRAQAVRLATALPARGVAIERLFVSPLVRARQTAEPLVTAWKLAPENVVELSELAPGGRCRKLARKLGDYPSLSIGLVGHRPDLNRFAAWLVGGKRAEIKLDKGGVALVHLEDGELDRGEGELAWLLPHDWV